MLHDILPEQVDCQHLWNNGWCSLCNLGWAAWSNAEIARLRAALDSQIETISGLGASLLERDAEIARLQQRGVALEKALDCKNFFSGKPGSPKVEWYEKNIFNEELLYRALGKEDARTVLGIWRRFKEATLRGGETG